MNTDSVKLIVGGKWFLEPLTLLLLTPYLLTTSILAAMAQLTSLGYPIENYWIFFAELFLANAIAFIACWALVSILNKTYLKEKTTSGTGLFKLVIISFSVGAAKGLFTSLASLPLGIFPDYSSAIGYKWIQTGVLGVLLLPLLSLVGHSLERIEAKHRLLVSERVQGLLSRNESANEETQLVLEFKRHATQRLDDLEEKLSRELENKSELIRHTILDLVDNHVKPLSRKIYKEDSNTRNPFSLPWTVETIYRSGFIAHAVAFSIIFVTLFMGYLQVVSPWQALAESGSVVLVIAVLTAPILLVKPRGVADGLVIFLVITGFSVMAGLVISDGIVPRQNPTNLSALGLILWLLVIQNMVLVSVGKSTLQDNRTLDAELEGIFKGTTLDAQAQKSFQEISSRNLAQFLHSNVQNRLLSASLALDVSRGSDAKAMLGQLREVIDSITQNLRPENMLTWETLANKIQTQWDGFIDCSFEREDDLETWFGMPNSLIYETVSECVSNALRHGNASKVKVRFESAGTSHQTLRISVEDNGFGPRNGRPGLGTKLIQSASRGNWNLEALPVGGSRLVCEIQTSS